MKSCLIPVTTLRSSPFSLAKGELVKVQMRARNAKGYGDFSQPNTVGALIQTEPERMPTPERGNQTSETQVHVTWSESTDSVLSDPPAVTSYHLQYRQTGSTSWSDVQGVSPFNLTREAIIQGTTTALFYDFQVRARNIYGWGPFSNTLSFRSAKVPADIATVVTTSESGTKVRAVWDVPSNGGLEITSYSVQFKNGQNSFVEINE